MTMLVLVAAVVDRTSAVAVAACHIVEDIATGKTRIVEQPVLGIAVVAVAVGIAIVVVVAVVYSAAAVDNLLDCYLESGQNQY